MQLPEGEERKKEQVSELEAFEVGATAFLGGKESHHDEEREHEPAREERSRRDVAKDGVNERAQRSRRHRMAKEPRVRDAVWGEARQ